MTLFQRILHPTDFQEKSAEAFGLACELARQNHAELIVLHVMPNGILKTLDKISEFAKSHEKLWDVLRTHRSEEDGLKVSHRLEEGSPAAAILQAAREADVDLLVIGPSNSSHVPLFWFTTTTLDELVHQAPCPVLVAKPKSQDPPPALHKVTNKQVAEPTLLSMEDELGTKFLP